MSLQDRVKRLEGKGDGECQKCGLAHPVVVLSSEPIPSKCRSCGGPLFIVKVLNEHSRELVNRLVSGELPEPRTRDENEEKEGAN